MKKNLSMGIIALVSLIITIYFYGQFPDKIPTHWNIHGEIDNYGSKPFIFITAIIPFIMLILKKVLPKIDPKSENYIKHKKAYNITINSIILFFVAIHQFIIFFILGYNINIPFIIKFLVGILLIIIGNYLSQVRQNFFFGIKTPWTLSDDLVWKKTHRIGSYLFVLSGITFILNAFTINIIVTYLSFLSIAIAAIIPIVYSYIVFRKKTE